MTSAGRIFYDNQNYINAFSTFCNHINDCQPDNRYKHCNFYSSHHIYSRRNSHSTHWYAIMIRARSSQSVMPSSWAQTVSDVRKVALAVRSSLIARSGLITFTIYRLISKSMDFKATHSDLKSLHILISSETTSSSMDTVPALTSNSKTRAIQIDLQTTGSSIHHTLTLVTNLQTENLLVNIEILVTNPNEKLNEYLKSSFKYTASAKN